MELASGMARLKDASDFRKTNLWGLLVNLHSLLKKITFGWGLATLCFSFHALAQTSCCDEGPLFCNAKSVQVKGGVTPSWFSSRERTLVSMPTEFPYVFTGPKGPQFDKIFNTPWTVGVELNWNASTNVQFFAEYAYVNASSKKHRFSFDEGDTFHLKHGSFQTKGFYLGTRYFFGNLWFDQCCCMGSISPFIGLKGGLVWNAKIRGRSHVELDRGDVLDLDSHELFSNNALMSAGLQMGLDWAINCYWGIVFTVEVVGVQSLRPNRNFSVAESTIVTTDCIPSNIHFGGASTIIEVPVTIGIRYTF